MSAEILVLTTCEGRAEARQLADTLVSARLAACINLVPGVESIYRWRGNIEHSDEVMLLIKTTNSRLAAVEAEIKARSSYELPEVLAVPVTAGSADYLGWIAASVAPASIEPI